MADPGKLALNGRTPVKQPDTEIVTGTPGKATLLPTSAAAIGDPYLENRERCATAGTGCFLTDVQRTRLINAYQDEVRTAETFFMVALTEMGVAEMIKKDDELPAIVTLVLDAFGAHAATALGKAFKALSKAPEKAADGGLEWIWAAQAGLSHEPDTSALRDAINTIDDTSSGFLIKTGVDAAKNQLKAGEANTENRDASDAKAGTLNYLDALKVTAAVAFEHQAQDPPGNASDGQLILLYHAYKAKNGHTVPGYKAALTEKLARYKASAASKIGRDPMHRIDPKASEFSATIRDTQVRWVVVRGVAKPVLYYYKRDFGFLANPSDKVLEAGYQDKSGGGNGFPAQYDEHMVIDRPVEHEFIETAIAKNKEVWGRDPTTEIVDASDVVRDVTDLNQFVPQNNPNFQTAPPAAPVPTNNQPVPVTVPDALKLK